jgi:glycosyltransferase involved in cell wall biosynthesis
MPDSEAAPGGRGYRVLMLAPTSFFGDYGCHVRILEETRYLMSHGHQVTICTYPLGHDLPGLDLRRAPSIPLRGDYEVGSSRHKIALDVLLGLRALGVMQSVRPDIIHSHLHEGALIGAALSALWRVPQVFDFQGSMSAEMVDHHFLRRDSRIYRATRRLERFIDQLAPRILTSTARASELLVSCFGCRPERIVHAPDCVSTAIFLPAVRDETWLQSRRALGIPDDRLAVVYLGLLADYQGTAHLLQAVALLVRRDANIHLLLGGYPNIEHYQQLAHSLGVADHVTFAGRVPYDQAPAFLALGDIAVAPKLSMTEGAGKILNYMAVGLPTVVYDTSASREYLGELGVYAEMGSAEALAARLRELMNDPGRRATLGAQLRQRAEDQYAWERTGRTILQTYVALLSEHHQPRSRA